VEVNAAIDLSPLNPGRSATLTVLQGDPEDETARPEESVLGISETLHHSLPAYSLSVIRFSIVY
jgi:hypothetical protein